MLIRDAEILGHGRADLRIIGTTIAQIGRLTPHPGEPTVMANGGALLPGLHDHHIHLAALAAQRASVACGPPAVHDAQDLQRALRNALGTGWIRGIGYHESVLEGLPDRFVLDRFVPDRPLRMQHRSGRMWLLNTPAIDLLAAQGAVPAGLQRDARGLTGHLFDEDAWLRQALGGTPPDFAAISGDLARWGVSGITDMSPRNDGVMARHFASQRESGALRQHAVLAGTLDLAREPATAWALGPAKLHLHEAALPDFDQAVAFCRTAHRQGRQVAVHCVSEVELIFALAVLDGAGECRGDRIEHVSIASPALLDQMAGLGLQACVQPSFVYERGDRYLADVEPRLQADLYRLRGLAERHLPLAGGSDAPYGSADPWAAMRAAVSRRTSGGATIGADEALSPEAALGLYLADPFDFTCQRRVAMGAPADLCLLARPWHEARIRLSSADVVATFMRGAVIHHRVDQSPGERLPSADPAP